MLLAMLAQVVLYWHLIGSAIGTIGDWQRTLETAASQPLGGPAHMNRTRSTLIGTAVAIALFGNENSARAADELLEEIVVTGIRYSNSFARYQTCGRLGHRGHHRRGHRQDARQERRRLARARCPA